MGNRAQFAQKTKPTHMCMEVGLQSIERVVGLIELEKYSCKSKQYLSAVLSQTTFDLATKSRPRY